MHQIQGQRPAGTAAGLRAGLEAVMAEVGALFQERDTEIQMIVTGLLAGQHTLLLGPPGTGKSAIVRELTGRLTDATYWEILLHKFIAPSAIFGPVDLAALTARGEHRQVLDGHATRAHVAFLDEIFKCSAAALNSMLAFLNERIYHPESGGAPIGCPLVSAVCASNELAEDETTAALYDRLLIRMEVDYLSEPDSFDALLRSAVTTGPPAARTTVALADVQHAVAALVPAVALPGEVIVAVRDLRADLRGREITSSDRRWKQAVRLLQGAAWLAGRDQVAVDDLAVLAHVLWDSPAHRGTVDRVVRGYLSPDDRDLADLADEVDRIAAELDKLVAAGDDGKLMDWAVGQNTKLAGAAKRLFSIRDAAARAGRTLGPYQRAADRAQHVYTRLLSEALGVDADKIPSLEGRAGGRR
ncbi:MoxR-like ATPase [Parafrankia irregularis]|uniref:MoxR-like ATPase n=1 Tax=Parafrankia irregularis TaxID=795642 RepID=A0A0S4R0R4_9ACTN|nr:MULTISPECIES: AAA family ATPase [Parafrankia]CUU60802.1 MoxR-like ATPase [Parafrankia irregularis]